MVLLLFLIISTAAAEHLDPHFVLGVQAGAGEAEIRRAYRAAALVNHPDKASAPGYNDANRLQPLPPPPVLPLAAI